MIMLYIWLYISIGAGCALWHTPNADDKIEIAIAGVIGPLFLIPIVVCKLLTVCTDK